MKRFLVRLCAAVITFSISIAVESISAVHCPDPITHKDLEVDFLSQDALGSSQSFDSTQLVPNFVFDYNPEEFNPRGTYHMIGRKPKDFTEVDSFELAVYNYDGIAIGEGGIQTYANQTFNGNYLVTGLATKRRLTFIATPLASEADTYMFEGHFLREGVLADPYRNRTTAVLEGKLIKSRACVKIAECDVRFRVEYLGC